MLDTFVYAPLFKKYVPTDLHSLRTLRVNTRCTETKNLAKHIVMTDESFLVSHFF
jgi:hypothetical protein